MGKLLAGMAALALFFNTLKAQEVDTTKIYPLDEIIVYDKVRDPSIQALRAASIQTIHQNDVAKSLTSNSGITTVMPFSSDINIHNLPSSQFAEFNYMGIPITSRVTQLQGGYSIINPDLATLKLHKTDYPAKHSGIGGVIEIKPAYMKDGEYTEGRNFKLSSDILQRMLTMYAPLRIDEIGVEGRSNVSIRNIQSIKPFNDWVKELRLLPKVFEFQNFNSFRSGKATFDASIRLAEEINDYEGNTRDVNKISQKSMQYWIFSRAGIPIDEMDLGILVGKEYERLRADEKSAIGTAEQDLGSSNTTLGLELNRVRFGGTFISLGVTNQSTSSNDKTINKSISVTRFWAETKHILYGFVVGSSAAAVTNGHKIHGAGGANIYIPYDDLEFTIGACKLVNFSIQNNSILGNYYQKPEEIRPQVGIHYSISTAYKNPAEWIEKTEILFYHKKFASDFRGKFVNGSVRGIDFWMGKDGDVQYKFIASISHSEIDNNKLPGAIDKMLEVDAAKSFKKFDMIGQLRYQDGYYYFRQDIQDFDRTSNSLYLNIGTRFTAGLRYTFVINNLLYLAGKKNELARFRDATGNYVSVSAPIWFNASAELDF